MEPRAQLAEKPVEGFARIGCISTGHGHFDPPESRRFGMTKRFGRQKIFFANPSTLFLRLIVVTLAGEMQWLGWL
jgi:hypothetical protein